MTQMMLDSSSVGHARCRNDHSRPIKGVDIHGLFGAQGQAEIGQGKGIITILDDLLALGIKKLLIFPKYFRSPDGQRTIQIHGHIRRQLTLLGQQMQ